MDQYLVMAFVCVSVLERLQEIQRLFSNASKSQFEVWDYILRLRVDPDKSLETSKFNLAGDEVKVIMNLLPLNLGVL